MQNIDQYISLLIQIPIVGIFVWFSLQLVNILLQIVNIFLEFIGQWLKHDAPEKNE